MAANLVHTPNVAHTYVEGMLSAKNILEAWESCTIPVSKTCDVPDGFVNNGLLVVEGTLIVAGDTCPPIQPFIRTVKTASYGVTVVDFGTVIEMNAAGATNVTLPTAVGYSGSYIIIKNIGAGLITMASTSSQTIDGTTAASYLIPQMRADTFYSNGANWLTLGMDYAVLQAYIIAERSASVTLSNHVYQPRVVYPAAASTYTPNIDTTDYLDIAAQNQSCAFNTPSGTPYDKQQLRISIKDNGSAFPLDFTTSTAYVSGGPLLPTTTVLSKILTLLFEYTTANSLNKWRLIALSQEG